MKFFHSAAYLALVAACASIDQDGSTIPENTLGLNLDAWPSAIICSTTANTLPVARVMYLSKAQDGFVSYEAIPKPERSAGHSQHFLIQFDESKRILLQLPRDPNVFKDCRIGMSIADLEAAGQTITYVRQ